MMETIDGNLYKITIMRIPADQNFDDPLSAVNGYVEAPDFAVGIIHTEKDDESWFIAFSEGNLVAEGDDLEDVANNALVLAKKKLELTNKEVSELLQIFSIQDDADYALDEVLWKYTLGNCGEVTLDENFVGGIIVNVTPYYSATISLDGKWGEASDDDDCEENHEFCGALIPQ